MRWWVLCLVLLPRWQFDLATLSGIGTSVVELIDIVVDYVDPNTDATTTVRRTPLRCQALLGLAGEANSSPLSASSGHGKCDRAVCPTRMD